MRVKTHRLPAYRIAQRAGWSPVALSKFIHGYHQPAPGKLARLRRVLGLDAHEDQHTPR